MNEKTLQIKTNNLTPEQIELVKNTIAKGATNDELQLFLYTANKTGLDPLTRQIHFVKRNVWNSKTKQMEEVGTIQTGIDGYRCVAERTGELAGIEDATFEERNNQPIKATVKVYRIVKGIRVPFEASARWNEYVPKYKDGKISPMWVKMPYLMLAKCAEALASRKGFPNDLSGIYTNEEMAQADVTVDIEKDSESKKIQSVANKGVGEKQKIAYLCKLLGVDLRQIDPREFIKEKTKLELVEENYREIVSRLEVLVQEKKEWDQTTKQSKVTNETY